MFSRNGRLIGHQDKINLTESEIADGYYAENQTQTVFEFEWEYFGIAICYDVEFQSVVSNFVRAGADLIFVPSYTSSIAGMNRVHISARARAHENQCYVIQSSARGVLADWHESAMGSAAIYGPITQDFSDTGELENISDSINLYVTRCDVEHLKRLRMSGEVKLHYQQEALLNRSLDLKKIPIVS